MSGRNGQSRGAAEAAPLAGSGVSGPTGSRTPPPVRTRLIGYARVSTAGQATDGISLVEQHHRISQYAQAHGFELAGVEIDRGVSGKSMGRPALQRALRRLKDGEAEGLVAVKLDRLSRSIRDTLDLVERSEREGWALHSIAERLDTGSAVGRFTVHLLGALAQLEREQLGERTRSALAELRRQGRRISGRPPLGFRFEGGVLVAVEAEQRVLGRLLELRAERLGARSIAKRFAAEGIGNPRTGKDWNPSTLASILRRLETRT